jgi:hypothetical protein
VSRSDSAVSPWESPRSVCASFLHDERLTL